MVLNQEFSRNIRDNETRLTFTPDECEGLPDAYLARVPRDAEAAWCWGSTIPDFNPFMANARNEEARRRYYIAYLNRGTSRNTEILDEIVALRRELASLYELPATPTTSPDGAWRVARRPCSTFWPACAGWSRR